MLVPRPLASPRQKTLPHNTDNSRLRGSGEVGSRNSRVRVYPACPIDATRPSNDTFAACYRFFAAGVGRSDIRAFPPQTTFRPNSRPFRNVRSKSIHGNPKAALEQPRDGSLGPGATPSCKPAKRFSKRRVARYRRSAIGSFCRGSGAARRIILARPTVKYSNVY